MSNIESHNLMIFCKHSSYLEKVSQKILVVFKLFHTSVYIETGIWPMPSSPYNYGKNAYKMLKYYNLPFCTV